MIKDPSFAIAWSVINKHQKGVIILLASIPILLIIKFIFHDYMPQEHSLTAYKIYNMILIFLTILMTMIFTFGEFSRDFGKSAFPKYTFTHPISSFQLAIVPILLGIMMSYFFYIAWFMIIVKIQLEAHQFLILFCCVSAGVSWLQVVSWRYNNAPFISISLMISIIASIAIIFESSWNIENLKPLINRNLAYLGLFLLPTSGVLLAINSVTQCRTNQTRKQNRFLSNVGFIGFNLPKQYKTISQALFRFEWRVFGWSIPMAGIFMVITLLFIASSNPTLPIVPLITVFSVPLLIHPMLLPLEMSKVEPWRNEKPNGISSFFSSLPVSNIELAKAKLDVAAKSIILTHFMVLLSINAIFIFLQEKSLDNPWLLLPAQHGQLGGGLILLGLNLMYPIIVWILAGNSLAWFLKGENFFTIRRVMIMLFCLSLLITLGYNSYHFETFRVDLISYAPLFNGLLLIVVAMIFYRAMNRFKTVESFDVIKVFIKPVTLIAMTTLMLQLFIFCYAGWITISNPHGALTLLSLTLLCILPYLIGPLSVAASRAR